MGKFKSLQNHLVEESSTDVSVRHVLFKTTQSALHFQTPSDIVSKFLNEFFLTPISLTEQGMFSEFSCFSSKNHF